MFVINVIQKSFIQFYNWPDLGCFPIYLTRTMSEKVVIDKPIRIIRRRRSQLKKNVM